MQVIFKPFSSAEKCWLPTFCSHQENLMQSAFGARSQAQREANERLATHCGAESESVYVTECAIKMYKRVVKRVKTQ